MVVSMARRQTIVRKADLRRVIDTLQERGVPLGTLDLLPNGEVRLHLGSSNRAIPSEINLEISSWDEALS